MLQQRFDELLDEFNKVKDNLELEIHPAIQAVITMSRYTDPSSLVFTTLNQNQINELASTVYPLHCLLFPNVPDDYDRLKGEINSTFPLLIAFYRFVLSVIRARATDITLDVPTALQAEIKKKTTIVGKLAVLLRDRELVNKLSSTLPANPAPRPMEGGDQDVPEAKRPRLSNEEATSCCDPPLLEAGKVDQGSPCPETE